MDTLIEEAEHAAFMDALQGLIDAGLIKLVELD
jgi:hypothetical protein